MGEGLGPPEPLEDRLPEHQRELPVLRVELPAVRVPVGQGLSTCALQSRIDGEAPKEPVPVPDDILFCGRGNGQADFPLIPEARIEEVNDVEQFVPQIALQGVGIEEPIGPQSDPDPFDRMVVIACLLE